eukprot:14565679-Ditylum_brightwellii.AAC.1
MGAETDLLPNGRECDAAAAADEVVVELLLLCFRPPNDCDWKEKGSLSSEEDDPIMSLSAPGM